MTYRRLLLASVYGVALAGWGAVWVAEWVHPMWMVPALAALLVGPWLDVRGKHPLKPSWNRALLVLGLGLAFIDWRYLSGSWFLAIVLLLMFVSTVRALSPKANRDLAQLVALGFLQLLAASVLTLNLGYAAFFLVVFLLLPWALLAVAVKAELEGEYDMLRGRVADPGPLEVPANADRVLTRGMAVAMFVALGMTAAVTTGFFLAFPRLNVGTFAGQLGLADRATSGLSDDLDLSGRGSILSNSAPAARVVQLEGDPVAAENLYLRAIALDSFDGRRWRNTLRDKTVRGPYGDVGLGADTGLPGTHKFRILLEDLGVNLLPVVPVARELEEMQTRVLVDELGTLRRAEGRGATKYEIESAAGRYFVGGIDWGSLPALERLPEGMKHLQAMRALPQDAALPQTVFVGAGAANLGWVAAQLERFDAWEYTVELPGGDDPLAAFFARQGGHCELFATAMALMLRAAGIPAVVVNGFRGAEYFDNEGYYLVRQRNAHSWVEFMHPALGMRWIPIDPTPAAPLPAGWRQQAAETWQRVVDRVQFFWYDRIAAYDLATQRQAVRATRDLARGGGDRLKALGARMRAWMDSVGRGLAWTMIALGGAAVAWFLWTLRGRRGGGRRSQGGERTPAWLRRWVRGVERRYGRRPTSLPLERWLAQLPVRRALRERLQAFARRYSAWRFAPEQGLVPTRALKREARALAAELRKNPSYT